MTRLWYLMKKGFRNHNQYGIRESYEDDIFFQKKKDDIIKNPRLQIYVFMWIMKQTLQ